MTEFLKEFDNYLKQEQLDNLNIYHTRRIEDYVKEQMEHLNESLPQAIN